MYFPYLRGKQFELLAIRELINQKLLKSGKIIPVIEPIRISSTLNITIDVAKENNFKLALIFNPEVGTITHKTNDLIKNFSQSVVDNHLYFGYITNKNMSSDIRSMLSTHNIQCNQFLLIHHNAHFSEEYNKAFPESDNPPAFNLIPDQRSYSRKIHNNLVLLTDHFNSQRRNSDFANETLEFFSEDHLFFKEEGFIGFADYLTIGSEYQESGFRPYAVAIHITSFDEDNNIIIHHFVSDTNDDNEDTPRKFYEALEKLVQWKKNSNTKSYALDLLQKHYDKQTYPGLGALKKYSIMHHIELMDQYLRG